jgi:hypothetical protein
MSSRKLSELNASLDERKKVLLSLQLLNKNQRFRPPNAEENMNKVACQISELQTKIDHCTIEYSEAYPDVVDAAGKHVLVHVSNSWHICIDILPFEPTNFDDIETYLQYRVVKDVIWDHMPVILNAATIRFTRH